MKYEEIVSVQDAIYFLQEFVESQPNSHGELTVSVLRSLFDTHIPNFPHIFKALTRGSGRPPINEWSKKDAVAYIDVLNLKIYQLTTEEQILWAVLNRNRPWQRRANQEYFMANWVIEVIKRRNCSASAAAQWIQRNSDVDDDGKAINARHLLTQYERYKSKKVK